MSGTVNAGELGVFIQRGKKLNAKHAKLGKQELSGSTESAALPSSLAGPYPRGRKHQTKDGELSPAASAVAAAGHARGLMIEQTKCTWPAPSKDRGPYRATSSRVGAASGRPWRWQRGQVRNGDASPVEEDPERGKTGLLEEHAMLRKQELQIQQMQERHERDMDAIVTMQRRQSSSCRHSRHRRAAEVKESAWWSGGAPRSGGEIRRHGGEIRHFAAPLHGGKRHHALDAIPAHRPADVPHATAKVTAVAGAL